MMLDMYCHDIDNNSTYNLICIHVRSRILIEMTVLHVVPL